MSKQGSIVSWKKHIDNEEKIYMNDKLSQGIEIIKMN